MLCQLGSSWAAQNPPHQSFPCLPSLRGPPGAAPLACMDLGFWVPPPSGTNLCAYSSHPVHSILAPCSLTQSRALVPKELKLFLEPVLPTAS